MQVEKGDVAMEPINHNPTEFLCLYQQGFVRIAAGHFHIRLASPHKNAACILEQWKEAALQGAALILFPELSLTAYSLDELHFQNLLLEEGERALEALVKDSTDLMTIAVIGMALRYEGALYNCAIVIHRGKILGIVPKTYLPRYREFYETRYFSSGANISSFVRLWGQDIPFGTDLIFSDEKLRNFTFAIEICEDLWAPIPPTSILASDGAHILLNLSASPASIGKNADRHLLCAAHSLRTKSAYIYAAAGEGESTTDLSWDGQILFYEAGDLLAENERFARENSFLIADIDVLRLSQERLHAGYFRQEGGRSRKQFFTLKPEIKDRGLLRNISRFPFINSSAELFEKECQEALTIQTQALSQRIIASSVQKMIIGVSGGLDSALALLVAVKTADLLGWSRNSILAYTMPGFATGKESLSYAKSLMEALGVSAEILDIRTTSLEMLKEIKHPFADGEALFDITFENVQAGLRTDFLFRLANHHHALVIGTGDLSELAQGWCTYGVGDQMAHYNVNSGLPKSFIQAMVRAIAYSKKPLFGEGVFSKSTCLILHKIVEAAISPELIPAGEEEKTQNTEEKIGPYALQDFTTFYVLRYGFSPRRIAFLAEKAWSDSQQGAWPCYYPESQRHAYDRKEIVKWLRVFMWRFFQTSQFKRSAMPNGPKIIAGISLSPRGDWRAPSDGKADLWLRDIDSIPLTYSLEQ